MDAVDHEQSMIRYHKNIYWERDAPVKCSSEDKIVVCRELLQASLEFTLVDEAACLVYDDEGEDGPGGIELVISKTD